MTLIDTLTMNGNLPLPVTIATLLILAISLWMSSTPRPKQTGKEPDALPDLPIPGILNAYKYIFHNMSFLQQAQKTLNGRNIMKFYLGPQLAYLVTGYKNVQTVIRNSGHLSSEALVLMVIENMDGVTAKDVQKFKNDKSGRGHIPLDDTPEKDRIWAANHRIFIDHLSSSTATEAMTKKFCDMLMDVLKKRKVGEWEELRLGEFIRFELVEAAIVSLAGTEILKLNEGFVEKMWKFDEVLYPIIFGVPRWLYRKGYKARDEFHEMGAKWLEFVFERDGEAEDGDWDEVWGSRFLRTHARFLKDRGLELRSRAGMALGSVWAQNANSVPIITWAMIETIKDKKLFQALRIEASTAFDINPVSKKRTINRKQLMELPLLQSVYAESMRLHVSVNVTRGVDQDMVLDGYVLKKGSIVQTPSMLGHLDEEYWSKPSHPATEFWAERFVTYVDEKDDSGVVKTVPKFSTAGIAGHWFPYGGGISICAGRHFAKQEIMVAVALLVVNFDIELLEYVHMDGSKSDRGPKDDPWWCGTAAMPPDRDLKIRWKRI